MDEGTAETLIRTCTSQCSGLLEHTDQVCNRGSSYDGIIYQNDPFTL